MDTDQRQMVWIKRETLLSAVVAVLLCARSAASVKCFCSDCPNEQNYCYGTVCVAQITYDTITEETEERWRCRDSYLGVCNVSKSEVAFVCCDSHDNCNANLHARLLNSSGFDNATINSTNSSNDSLTTVSETLPTSTTNSTNSTGTTPPSIPTTSGSIECILAESSTAIVTSTKLCSTTTSCFISLRVRSGGAREFKWGCTRDGAPPCREENRNRKKKYCCQSWFCNQHMPDWLSGGLNTPATDDPGTATPTSTTEGPTRPPPANLTTSVTPTEGVDPNCTVTKTNSDVLTSCVTPGSVSTPDMSAPEFSGPIIVPEDNPDLGFRCYCSTCRDNYVCHSAHGCAWEYDYDHAVDGLLVSRFCIPDQDYFDSVCGSHNHLQTVCCTADMCNAPPPFTGTTELPTATDTPPCNDTEPITMATSTKPPRIDDTSSEASTNEITDSPPTTVNPSETDAQSKDSYETDSLLFYALSIVLGVLMVSLGLVMVVMCYCCYSHHKRLRNNPVSSRRQQGKRLGGAREGERVGLANSYSISTASVLGERTTSSEKMADISRENSCNTGTTFTRTSTPESTV